MCVTKNQQQTKIAAQTTRFVSKFTYNNNNNNNNNEDKRAARQKTAMSMSLDQRFVEENCVATSSSLSPECVWTVSKAERMRKILKDALDETLEQNQPQPPPPPPLNQYTFSLAPNMMKSSYYFTNSLSSANFGGGCNQQQQQQQQLQWNQPTTANTVGVTFTNERILRELSSTNIAAMVPAIANMQTYHNNNNINDDDDGEDVDECLLDEDEWTESTGSSSISSACFLQSEPNNNTRVQLPSCLSSSFSVLVPTQCYTGSSKTTCDAVVPRSTTTTNGSVSLSLLPRVEVRPGVTALFLGAQETWNCICGRHDTNDKDGGEVAVAVAVDAYDEYKFVTCANPSCQASLCCVQRAEYVLCPDCRVLSQTTTTKDADVKEQQPSNPTKTTTTTSQAATDDLVLAGLGFTFNDMRNWELRQNSL